MELKSNVDISPSREDICWRDTAESQAENLLTINTPLGPSRAHVKRTGDTIRSIVKHISSSPGQHRQNKMMNKEDVTILPHHMSAARMTSCHHHQVWRRISRNFIQNISIYLFPENLKFCLIHFSSLWYFIKSQFAYILTVS